MSHGGGSSRRLHAEILRARRLFALPLDGVAEDRTSRINVIAVRAMD